LALNVIHVTNLFKLIPAQLTLGDRHNLSRQHPACVMVATSDASP
jgi:hypothetical protein